MALKIYISGAITGTTDYKRRFKAAERIITAAGFEAVNPLNLDFVLNPETTTWEQYMHADLGLLKACDSVYMIPGWEKSKGACIEYEYAQLHGKKIVDIGGRTMEAFEVLTNIKNWTGYDFKGYSLSRAEAEACISALEKATPKQPRRDEKYIWKCPECGKAYGDAEEDRHEFCPTCGQAIRWSKEDET